MVVGLLAIDSSHLLCYSNRALADLAAKIIVIIDAYEGDTIAKEEVEVVTPL